MAQPRASTLNGSQGGNPTGSEKTYFEQQREILISEIAQSLEHVLQNINSLNRSLEEVIQVGNEFAPVESLWSHFENVMAKEPATEGGEGQGHGHGHGQGHEEGETNVEGEGETEFTEVEGK